MFHHFLHTIGLGHLTPLLLTPSVASLLVPLVRGTFEREEEDVSSLYEYPVPRLGPNGSCSLRDVLEEKPYNLADIFGQSEEVTLRLRRLRQIVSSLEKSVGADWLGIYKKVKKGNGELVLVKESYYGAPSRAEFPLTHEFAEHSNNSTVGLTGKAIVIQNVAEHAGPYYQCDGRVQSEFCCPILDSEGSVIGIIDAESFSASFFTPEKLLQIAKVCHDLGRDFQ